MSMSSAPSQPPVGDGALDHALALAALGLRVLPIRPGGKHPPMAAWQHAATTDEQTIRNWWNGLYRDCGIGVAMGRQPDGRCLVAIDVDEHDPAASGSDTLAELEELHGALPDTVRSITGAGGAHMVYEVPTEIGNGASGAVGPGIDVRGQGGQIVVAPTVHPNGNRYAWEHGHEPWTIAIAEAPGWLLERIASSLTPPNLKSTPNIPSHGDTPADRLRATWDWPTELARRGWQHARSDRNGDTHWTRPGKDPREGTSAVLHAPDGPFVVFTTDATAAALWKAGKAGNGNVSLTPFQFLAAYDHGGDLSAAAKAIAGPEAPLSDLVAPAPNTPTVPPLEPDAELRAMLIDWPEFWARDYADAEWLVEPVIAAKRSHAIFAPGGTGKSLLALWMAAGLATGRPMLGNHGGEMIDVLYLDYEMTADDLAERLEAMGYGGDANLGHLHYALLPALPGLDEPEGGRAVVRLAEMVGAQLVIIDTFGRAVHGDENDADTVRAWYRWTGLHLKAAGRAFLRVDHAGKDLDKGQRGSSAKNDDVDVVWRLTQQDEGTFKLVAKKKRMAWVPETVELGRNDDDTLRYTLQSGSVPAGTKAVIDDLDRLGVPSSDSLRRAAQILRDAGKGARNDVIRAAQKARKQALGIPISRGGRPVDNSVLQGSETAPQTSGRGYSDDRAPSDREPPGAIDETPAQTVGRGSGRGWARLADATGARCAPPVGGAPAQRDPEQPVIDLFAAPPESENP